MRLTEDKVRRIAERLHDELEQRGLLTYKEAPGSRRGEPASSGREIARCGYAAPLLAQPRRRPGSG